MYYYNAYDLKILSELKIEQLDECVSIEHDDIDIFVNIKSKNNNIFKSKLIHKNKNNVAIEAEGIASYTIEDGRYIQIDADSNASMKEVTSFLLSWPFGYIFIQRDIMALHASSVVMNSKAIAIVGETEAGKSTLANGLINKGYKFLSDDICIVDLNREDKPILKPSIPVNKIRPDMVESLGYKLDYKNLNERMKISMIDNIVKTEKELDILINLEVADVDKVIIEEITGELKIHTFMNNIYLIDIAKQFGTNHAYIKKCLSIVKNIRMYRMLRPVGKFTVNEQVELIENIC